MIVAAAVVIGVALVKLKQQVDTLADKTGDLTEAVGHLQETVTGLESSISDGAAE